MVTFIFHSFLNRLLFQRETIGLRVVEILSVLLLLLLLSRSFHLLKSKTPSRIYKRPISEGKLLNHYFQELGHC